MTDVDDWRDYSDDRDYPTAAQIDDYEDRKAAEEHENREHGGGPCNCPLPTPEEIEAQWAQREQEHRAEAHDGGECDCTAPF